MIVTVKRNKGSMWRMRRIAVDVSPGEEGFEIKIFHHAGDEDPVVIRGFIGHEKTSTVVEQKGAPRIKRVTDTKY